LALLFYDERRATLRARLRNWHIWRCEVAIWVSRAAVKNSRTPTSTAPCASAPHKFTFFALRALDPHGDRPRVLALRIAGASDEIAKSSMLFDQPVAAQRALLV